MSDPITFLGDYGIGGVLAALSVLSVGAWALGWALYVLAARLVRPWRARRVLRMPEPPAAVVAFDVDTSGVVAGIAAAKASASALAEAAAAPASWRPPRQYESACGMRWEAAPPAKDGTPSVRLAGHNGLAWPLADMDRLYSLTPIDTNTEVSE